MPVNVLKMVNLKKKKKSVYASWLSCSGMEIKGDDQPEPTDKEWQNGRAQREESLHKEKRD